MSNSHVVHFDKHVCHEKVTTTGDYAVQAILLTGKVYLCLKREKQGFVTNLTRGFLLCASFEVTSLAAKRRHLSAIKLHSDVTNSICASWIFVRVT